MQEIDDSNKKWTISVPLVLNFDWLWNYGGMNHLHEARLSNDMVKILLMVLLSEQMLLHAIEEDLDRRSDHWCIYTKNWLTKVNSNW